MLSATSYTFRRGTSFAIKFIRKIFHPSEPKPPHIILFFSIRSSQYIGEKKLFRLLEYQHAFAMLLVPDFPFLSSWNQGLNIQETDHNFLQIFIYQSERDEHYEGCSELPNRSMFYVHKIILNSSRQLYVTRMDLTKYQAETNICLSVIVSSCIVEHQANNVGIGHRLSVSWV